MAMTRQEKRDAEIEGFKNGILRGEAMLKSMDMLHPEWVERMNFEGECCYGKAAFREIKSD